MITLLSVKKFNKYDFVQDTQPTSDGTWLDTTDGKSYQVTGGTTTRIEEIEDARIEESIFPTIENVCSWLNNWFYIRRQTQDKYSYGYYFERDYSILNDQRKDINLYESESGFYTFADTGVITGLRDNILKVDDLVQVKYAVRNNLLGYVTNQSDGTITLNNTNIRNTEENATLLYMELPRDVESIISEMINYDVFEREVTDLSSESVGNYSYTRYTVAVGGLDYPNSMVSRLRSHRSVGFRG